jgi:hypothetical protein
MKNYIVSIIIPCLLSLKIYACDICGCSVSGSYFGIFPQYRKHFIGLRSNYRNYRVKHPPLFAGENVVYSKDLSFNNEIWGKYQVHKKLQMIAVLPFLYNQRKENDLVINKSGIGDITCFLLYSLLSPKDSLKFKHQMVLGTGLKIPTGSYQNTMVYKDVPLPGFQMGTASWDIPLSLLYTLKRKSLGLNLEINYQWNTINRYEYQFGNKLSSAIRVFHWKYNPILSFLPQIGISYENFQRDKKNSLEVKYTGGNALWAHGGIDLYKGKWGLGLNAWVPIYQNIGEKHIQMLPRLSTNFLYLL